MKISLFSFKHFRTNLGLRITEMLFCSLVCFSVYQQIILNTILPERYGLQISNLLCRLDSGWKEHTNLLMCICLYKSVSKPILSIWTMSLIIVITTKFKEVSFNLFINIWYNIIYARDLSFKSTFHARAVFNFV